MRRQRLICLFVLLLAPVISLTAEPVAQVAQVSGKLVRIDPLAKELVLQTPEGEKTYKIVTATRVLDAKGIETKEGLKDKRLQAGVEVKLVLTVTGKTVREIHLPGVVAAAVAADKAAVRAGPAKADAQGDSATVLKVDADSRTAQVQLENGRKMELKIEPDAKFIGPKGGVSTKGIKDDRFKAGAQVRLVIEGDRVKEIHLPIRK